MNNNLKLVINNINDKRFVDKNFFESLNGKLRILVKMVSNCVTKQSKMCAEAL